MYWINERCYKTLEDALMTYEEYKKNERILNGEGLASLPNNLNIRNHYQEVVPGIIEEVSAYDTLGNKIATWTAYKSAAAKDNKNIINCRNCGAPVRSYICEYCGTVY